MMKKTIYALIIFLMFIGTTNAAKCNVVSGTGENIGDEIACGTEHFFVLSNDGTTIRMLAKYNLYAGIDYELKELDKSFDTYEELEEYVKELYSQEYAGIYDAYLDENNKYSSVMLYKMIDNTKIKQESDALGAHGDEPGHPSPIQKGVISLREGGYASPDGYSEPYGGEYYYDFTLLEGGLIEPYITAYYQNLNKDYNIHSIDLLSVKELNSVVTTITGEELPLEQWGYDLYNRSMNLSEIYIVGSIKELLPEKYSWLWTTTYWTKTGTRPYEANAYTFFIDAVGDLCAAGSCVDVIGAGLRPVVVMSSNNIFYNIKVKTDGNGTIESTHIEAEQGELIKFTTNSKDGYILEKVKITDENGNSIIYTDNTFTMPNANVTIEATFIKIEENPETSDITIVICLLLIISGIAITYSNLKKMDH